MKKRIMQNMKVCSAVALAKHILENSWNFIARYELSPISGIGDAF